MIVSRDIKNFSKIWIHKSAGSELDCYASCASNLRVRNRLVHSTYISRSNLVFHTTNITSINSSASSSRITNTFFRDASVYHWRKPGTTNVKRNYSTLLHELSSFKKSHLILPRDALDLHSYAHLYLKFHGWFIRALDYQD